MDTPSQEIIAASNATEDLKDALGRAIQIKRLNALDRMRLFEIVGADNVRNDYYLGYATLAFQVVKIDGENIPRPNSKIALEGLVQRLGDDGITAVAEAMKATASETDSIALVKNAPSTPN